MKNIFYHNKIKLAYNKEGIGFPVLLLHGFAEDGDVWKEQVAYLKNHCMLITPDLPGSGESVFCNEEETAISESATIEFYADCVRDLLAHENIDCCIMCGHSMGGYITLAFAEKYGEMLKGFALIHSTAFADSDEKKNNRLKGIAMMEEYGLNAFLRNTTPNLFGTAYKKLYPEKIQGLIKKGSTFSLKAMQQYYRAMMNRPDRKTVLSESKVPVLLIAGTEDVAVPFSDVLEQSHLPSIAYINILKDAGHMGLWENIPVVNNAMLAFIKALI